MVFDTNDAACRLSTLDLNEINAADHGTDAKY